MRKTSTRLRSAHRKRPTPEETRLPVQRETDLKERDAPYADRQTTINVTTCSQSRIIVPLLTDEKEGEMMVVKVGKAEKAEKAIRMVKGTSRSRKTRNALLIKLNADTEVSVSQLAIQGSATIGTPLQNGKS